MFACECCDYTSDRAPNVYRHMKAMHVGYELTEIVCIKCRITMNTVEMLNHESKCTTLHILQCPNCLRMFSNKHQKAAHKRKYAGMDCKVVNQSPDYDAEESDSEIDGLLDGDGDEDDDEEGVGKEGDDQDVEVIQPSSLADTFQVEVVNTGYMINGQRIRKTNETPTRISVYDLISAITHMTVKDAFMTFDRLQQRHSDVSTICGNIKFPGQGQRLTPVTDAKGMVMIINLLPGSNAAKFRSSTAEVLVRYLGGDKTLIDEINSNAEFQQSSEANGSILGVFGEAVQVNNQQIVVRSSAPKFSDSDIVPSPDDERYKHIPEVAFAPNGVYIMCLGLDPQTRNELGMWGLGESLHHRTRTQFKAYKFSKVTVIITCGKASPVRVENSVKNFMTQWHFPIQRVNGTMNTECFSLPAEEARAIYKRAIDMISSSHDEVETITFYGEKVMDKTSQAAPWLTDSMGVEKERTLQAMEVTKQNELIIKQKEIDERIATEVTKQKELDLKKTEMEFNIMKLKVEHNLL